MAALTNGKDSRHTASHRNICEGYIKSERWMMRLGEQQTIISDESVHERKYGNGSSHRLVILTESVQERLLRWELG